MNMLNISKQSKSVKMLMTIMVGLIGGLVFTKINMPLPSLLGPMTALLIGSRFFKISFYWSANVRNLALIIIGYTLGLSINKDTIFQIIQQLPWMLVMTAALTAFGAVTALLISKLSGIDYPSVLIGNVPGALTQMTVMGEEMEGTNLTVITFLQVVRVILVVFCVPLIIFSPLYSVETSVYTAITEQAASVALDVLIPKIILFTIISLFFAILGKKLKIPIPYLLGPILGIAVLNISGFHGPKPSSILLDIAQFSVGCRLGLMLNPEKIPNKVKLISLGIINGVVMIMFSLVLSYILIKMHGIEATTSFLSTAPGGADQMGLIASVISADVSMVTGYQLFRMLFVNFVVPPFLKRFCIYLIKNNQTDSFESRKDIQC